MRRTRTLIAVGLTVLALALVLRPHSPLRVAQHTDLPTPAVDPSSFSSDVAPPARPSNQDLTASLLPRTSDSSGTWPAETLIVRAADGLVNYSLASGRQRFRLPAGVLTADDRHYVTVEPNILPATWKAFHPGEMVLKVLDPRTSFIETSSILQGLWTVSGVSQTARWVALTRVPAEGDTTVLKTDVQIVDTYRGVGHTVSLDGNFEVLAITPDGSRLVLLERLPALQPDHSALRMLSLNTLSPPAADRRSAGPADVMTDYAVEGGTSPDGRWLVTLSLSTQRHLALVHVLDLVSGTSWYVDLPSGSGAVARLKAYALVFSPDSKTVLAANAALGSVAHISLPGAPHIVRSEQFVVWDYATPQDYPLPGTGARGVVSPDGAKLYFTNGWDVWAYDTQAGTLDGPYLFNSPITQLGLSGDGARLYVATLDGPLQVFDASNGHELWFTREAVDR